MIKAHGKYRTTFAINVIGYAKSFLWRVPIFSFKKVTQERINLIDKYEPEWMDVKND